MKVLPGADLYLVIRIPVTEEHIQAVNYIVHPLLQEKITLQSVVIAEAHKPNPSVNNKKELGFFIFRNLYVS